MEFNPMVKNVAIKKQKYTKKVFLLPEISKKAI